MYIKNIKKIILNEGFEFKHYKKVKSTMIKIRELFNSKDIVLIADHQSKGIGRRGSIWHSPIGNIYISFIIKMKIDIKDHFIYNALTTLSISKTIDKICNINSKIKWPNDIMIGEKKISGVMTEIFKYKNNNYILIGAGINVSSSPNFLGYPTAFVKQFNAKANKSQVIELFVFYFFKHINNLVCLDIIKDFKDKLLFINKKISLKTDDSNFINGVFKDINLDGGMIININGEKKTIYSARIIDAK